MLTPLGLTRALGVALVGIGAAFGCNQLLGIEEAKVDPALMSSETTNGTGGSLGSDADAGTTKASSAASDTTGGAGASFAATSSGDGEAGASGVSNGTSGSTASTGSGGSGSTTTSGGGPTLCDSYCDDIMEVCTGDLLQYRDKAQCLAVCTQLPEGALGETNVNSVACRAKFAGDARYANGTELTAYCLRAGPGGGTRCGSNCEGLCSIMMHVCTPEVAGVYHFETIDECLDACATLPELETGYSASDPLVADGNHVQCRLFHAMSAAMLDPEEHCQHALGITLCEAGASE